MTRDAARFARVKEIYLAAFEIDEAERPTFVTREAGDDPTLAEEVLRLFGYAADPRAPVGGELAPGLRGVVAPLVGDGAEIPTPERLGGYRVLRRVGAGGMGVVYEAEQETPRRRVALKVLQASLLGEDALRRFKVEAETLGRMQHPGVAQVYEARHERDACFIAMEFVAGRTFDRWVAEERPDRRRLLETLALVCDGVEHAHLRGVIHRDLKPGNILVDDAGRPKIIDFGIAREVAVDGGADSRTRFGEVLGTLAYMSPEQASGDPALVDLRSDVYALGALAYQALFGAPPHDVDRLPLAEALRVVAEAPTPRPSARDPRFPRELETVLLTALEKDRERRYRTAAAFAADLRAFLTDRPISAHPPSGWYLARKFARRHRGVVAAAALVLVSVVAGSIASTYYALRADAAATESAGNAAAALRNADEAIRRGYAALIGSAAAAVDAARPEEAARSLDATEPSLRGFEYEYLRARLAGCEREFGADGPRLDAVAFTADGTLVDGRPGGALTATDPATGERRDWPTPAGLTTFDAGPATEDVVAGFADGSVRAFDGAGATRAVRDLGAGPVRRIGLSPDGRRALVVARDGLFVWDRAADRATPFAPSRPGRGRADSLAWSADGARLSSTRGRANTRYEVESYDATTGFGAGVEHVTTERLTAIDYSPDGRFGAFGTAHPSVRVVDLASERLAAYVRGRSGPILAVRWLADGKRFLAGDAGGAVTLYELGRAEPVRGFPGLGAACVALAVDPAERFVAAAGGGRVRLWRLDGATDAAAALDHASYVWAVAFNPSGDLLASAAWDGTLRLWDGWTLARVGVLDRGIGQGPRGLRWSDDGRRLDYLAHHVRSYDVAAGRLIAGDSRPADDDAPEDVDDPLRDADPARRYGPPVGPGGLLRVRRDGRRGVALATAEGGGERLIAVDGGAAQWTFSPDGARVAVAGLGGEIVVGGADEAAPIVRLAGHEGGAHAVAFSPDGKRLASGGLDRAVRLWDTTHWYETAVLRGHLSGVRSLDFSADGGRLASGGSDRSVRVWSTAPRQAAVARSDAARRRRAATTRPAAAASAPDAPTTSDAIRAGFEAGAGAEDRRAEPPRSEARGVAEDGFGSGLALLRERGRREPFGVVVAAPTAAPRQTGAVEVRTADLATVRYRLAGTSPTARFGSAVTALGDLDRDGVDDFVVAADGEDVDGIENAGSLTYFSGRDGRLLRVAAGPGLRLRANGRWLDAGDLNGDGLRDLVGVRRRDAAPDAPEEPAAEDGEATARGASSDEFVAISSADGGVLWSGRGPQAIRGLHALGDLDGDGAREIASQGVDGAVSVLDGRTGAPLRALAPAADFRRERAFYSGLPIVEGGGDRPPEFAVFRCGARRATLRRLGRDDATSWSVEIARAAPQRFPESVGDVDGDGLRDLALRVVGRVDAYGAAVELRSGRDGATFRLFEAGPDDERFGAAIAVDPQSGVVYLGAPGGGRPGVFAFPLPNPPGR